MSYKLRIQEKLKIQDRVNIIKLHDEAPNLGTRKFTDFVNTRLGIKTSRTTVQRILKNKDKILGISEQYWNTRSRTITQVQSVFENELYDKSVRNHYELTYEAIKHLGSKILQEKDEYKSLREKMRFSNNWFKRWLKTYDVNEDTRGSLNEDMRG